jgi:tetratricopeptide (TPR) repeat protein
MFDEGDVEAAIRLAEELLARDEKSLGPEHAQTLRVMNRLASLYIAREDYARAERLLQRSLFVSEKVFGPEHPSVANVLGDLAEVFYQRKDYAQAEALLTRALSMRERGPRGSTPTRRRCWRNSPRSIAPRRTGAPRSVATRARWRYV